MSPSGVVKGFNKGDPLRRPRTNSSKFTFEENITHLCRVYYIPFYYLVISTVYFNCIPYLLSCHLLVYFNDPLFIVIL